MLITRFRSIVLDLAYNALQSSAGNGPNVSAVKRKRGWDE